jgi:hypothetical protein
MLGIGSAAAISTKEYFMAALKGSRHFNGYLVNNF